MAIERTFGDRHIQSESVFGRVNPRAAVNALATTIGLTSVAVSLTQTDNHIHSGKEYEAVHTKIVESEIARGVDPDQAEFNAYLALLDETMPRGDKGNLPTDNVEGISDVNAWLADLNSSYGMPTVTPTPPATPSPTPTTTTNPFPEQNYYGRHQEARNQRIINRTSFVNPRLGPR